MGVSQEHTSDHKPVFHRLRALAERKPTLGQTSMPPYDRGLLQSHRKISSVGLLVNILFQGQDTFCCGIFGISKSAGGLWQVCLVLKYVEGINLADESIC